MAQENQNRKLLQKRKMTTADYLKFYSEKGWQVFPVKARDKTPLVKWADVATTEINMLNGWLEMYPNMNIGLATGKRSGVFVLDVDAGHDGFVSLESLESKYGKLPNTPVVQTGGGGRHYFFKHPNTEIRNVQNSGKLGRGLDVRGDGGYVVAAGSTHSTGNPYKWLVKPSETPLADAPQWMIDILKSDAPQMQKPSEVVTFDPAVPNGGRNNYLTSLAGAMRRRGVGQDALVLALMAENKAKCIPPLSDDEVRKIAESVTRYNPNVTFEENRDRLQVEWAFCKSVFEFPSNIPDFLDIQSSLFGDYTLAKFWAMILDNQPVTDAALSAGILTELERYKDYDASRLDAYANAIKRFGYLADVKRRAEALAHQAASANDAGIEKAIQDITRLPSIVGHVVSSIGDVADDLEKEIKERARNPVDVWGIHYAWPRLSKLTGGKQKGELVLFSGEPKTGKSWWCLQDALYTAIGGEGRSESPIFYWCGEMKRKQIMRRFYQILGVNGNHMKTGRMTEQDWDILTDAKALIMSSPIFIDDAPLALHELRPMLMRQKAENGIQQFVIDYAMKIRAPGKDETEQTANISSEVKDICNELDLSGILITSVNKTGMDSLTVQKSNVRGSGQQIHDADVIYILTKFNGQRDGVDYGVMPQEYDRTVSLHVAAGRELDFILEGGFIPYKRMENCPKFQELEKVK